MSTPNPPPSMDKAEHISFVESLLQYADTAVEKRNYQGYLKAIRSNLLDCHQGRYVYIVDGRFLNKSFETAHYVVDHLFECGYKVDDKHLMFNNATFVYVPSFTAGKTARTSIII